MKQELRDLLNAVLLHQSYTHEVFADAEIKAAAAALGHPEFLNHKELESAVIPLGEARSTFSQGQIVEFVCRERTAEVESEREYCSDFGCVHADQGSPCPTCSERSRPDGNAVYFTKIERNSK